MPDAPVWDFFLAHAAADGPAAKKLFDLLQPSTKVFLDSESLLFGDDWDIKLPRAQSSSRVTVVLVSGQTETAYYQREEIASAIAMAREPGERHRVVPVYLDDRPFDKNLVPYGLRLKHSLSLKRDGGFRGVAKHLQNLHVRLTSTPESLLDKHGISLQPLPPTALPIRKKWALWFAAGLFALAVLGIWTWNRHLPRLDPKDQWLFADHQKSEDWRLPTGWTIIDDKEPQLVLGGASPLLGGPKYFDRKELSDFVVSFFVSPSDHARAGTKLLSWLVRTNPNQLPPKLRHFPRLLGDFLLRHASLPEEPDGFRQISGYEFQLVVDQGGQLELNSSILRLPLEPGHLSPPARNLPIPCCRAVEGLEVLLRVRGNAFEHCIKSVNPKADTKNGGGTPQSAYFIDDGNLFSSGSFGFISSSESVVVTDIKVYPMTGKESDLNPKDNVRRYYGDHFSCDSSL